MAVLTRASKLRPLSLSFVALKMGIVMPIFLSFNQKSFFSLPLSLHFPSLCNNSKQFLLVTNAKCFIYALLEVRRKDLKLLKPGLLLKCMGLSL